MRKIITTIVLMLVLSSLNAQQKPAEYDLVILNGRVMDPETMFDAIANVGIKDGKIVMITKSKITGKEIINAKGHVVAPGFIDPHSHNVPTPFGQKLALRDGVTTPLELELGVLPINFWYDQMKGKSQTNYGASASVEAAREKILNPNYQTTDGALINDASIMDETHLSMAWSKDVASDEQVNQILDLVEEGLKQGGLGIGYTPGYMVYGVRTEEGVGAQKLAGKYRRFVYLHGRFSGQLPPNDGLTGTLQQLGAAEAYGGGLVIAHMTAQTLSQTKEAQAIIDAAARKGIPVISEIYAYTYGSTIVAADYLEPDNYQNNMGHDYKDIVNLTDMKPLTKETYEQLKKDAPTTNVTFENATKEDLYWALSHPTSIIGSDAFPGVSKIDKSLPKDWDTPYESVNAHPRGAGTHARILRLVREENLMSLMLAVSKMTFMPAKFLQENGVDQMTNKGRLQVGKDADITIFDPATIKDNATPQMGTLPSTGIPYVIVNGTVVVKDSKVLKDVYPGQPIRAEIQE
ncbi:amidohydrolase family protein [Xanthomarina spongicola]|uniref:N-acyl-D-glutamate deacylase n=1 Tax=Xanthomarina spongicola TaxID=570520 RepID=A0A316DNN7_9FLAO|nr:amidohydrolase family protein [Xanthomarina spongicola]PWK19654.1 N-acyl-D-glutamate deacylase [Xanthomarina spongicola]